MSGTRKLTIEIAGDAKGAGRAFDDAGKGAGGFSSIMQGVGQKSGQIMFDLGIKAFAMIPGILSTGANMEALGKKAETVFGDSLGQVQSWADANASAMGLTSKEATGLAAGIGDLLKPMGFTSDQAGTMSTDLLNLSGALSAWSGGQVSASEVSDIMTSALLGETDGLKQLGISISASDIQARLAKKGQENLTGAALEQAQALATQELIMEKSTDAQTAWADGSMDAIKAQNESKASIDTLKETLISALYPALQSLVPIVTDVATWLGENLPGAIAVMKEKMAVAIEWIDVNVVPIFQKIVDWVVLHWPEISAYVTQAMTDIRDIITTVLEIITTAWNLFGDSIMAAIDLYWGYVKSQIEGAMKTIEGVIDLVMGLITGDWGRAWEGIKGIIDGIWTGIKGLIDLALGVIGLALSAAWDGIKATASAAWDGIKSAITDVWDAIATFIDDTWETIKTTVSDGIDSVVGFIGDIPGAITDAVSGAFDSIWDSFKGVINKIIDGWNNLDFPDINFPGFKIPFSPDVPGFTVNMPGTPNIPRLHSGGHIPGGPSDEMLAILQGGETVLTRDESARIGASGNTYVFQFNAPIMAKQDVASELYDMIIEGQQTGALVGSLAGVS